MLGVTVASAPPGTGAEQPRKPWREWSATEFEVDSSRPVPAGVDGEAMTLEPPLRFRIRPGRAEGADRAGASGRLAVGRNPGEILGRRADLGGRSGRQGARAGLKSGAGINPTTEGAPMDILEIEQKETLSREEAAARLKRFAEMLSKNNDLEFERGGMQIKVHVPDEVRLKVELELETDERELEIELTW